MSTPNPVTPIVAPVVGSPTGALVDTYLKPYLQASKRRSNKRKALDELTLFGGFAKYLERAYGRHSELTTLALQGKPRLLSDLYIPLTLVRSAQVTNTTEKICVNCYPDALLPQLQRVLLTDDAGMGKSTLVKFLFLKCIESNAGLPILIELRRLRDGKGISDVLADELCEVCPEIERETMTDVVRELLEAGEFVFLLDGYDEVPFDERERVALHLREFVSRAGHDGRNAFLISSRPDSGVSSLPGFHSFHIQPLEVEQAFDLLRKYDSDGDLSKQLIAELENQMSSVEEFLTNPMLVSLLFEAYDYTNSIPLKKAAFYRQVYDAIFERHDATKPLFKREKHSKLDKDDFERVLRALGIRTLKGGVGYSKDELLKLIVDARQMCPGLTFKESDFLEDLLSTVPLFAREGDYHRWKHKSLQEYFAARYICSDLSKEEQAKVLRQMAISDGYFQMLGICYDLDYRNFRNTLIYDVVKKFVTYYDSTYIGIDRISVDESLIHERKMFCFSNIYIAYHKNNSSDLIRMLENSTESLKKLLENYVNYDWLPLENSFVDALEERENFFGYSMDFISIYPKPESIIESLMESKNHYATKNGMEYVDWREFEQIVRGFDGMSSATVIMDDNPQAFFNRPQHFYKINKLLSFFGSTRLIIDKCRQLKLEIEVDLERESSGSILGLL